MLYNLIITPIETLVELIFTFILNKFSFLNAIGAVFGVSLAINFLALPLYNIADSLQEKERLASRKLEPRVKRIKAAFKGDEQFMMLQTYYRQNGYHPLYALRASLSILIEIPFFIAAYHFLSHNEALRGSSFWIFRDLGAPDGLLHIGTFPVHILPVLMTLINFVSGAVYAKDAPVREKIQLVAIASIFLVLLYNSPSGLVLYWILNNIFSLVKNIVLKTKNPGRIAHVAVSAVFLLAALIFWVAKPDTFVWKKLAITFLAAAVAFIPLLVKKIRKDPKEIEDAGNKNLALLIFSGLALTLFSGMVLPSSVIATSPAEFSFLGKTENPVSYIWSSVSVFAGFFLFWPLCIYKLFGNKVKQKLPWLMFILLVTAILNVYLFKPDYGNLNSAFKLDTRDAVMNQSFFLSCLPVITALIISAAGWLLVKFRKTDLAVIACVSTCIAALVLGTGNINKISATFRQFEAEMRSQKEMMDKDSDMSPVFHLSRTEKNVVVIFLDRAVNFLLPYVAEEFPEINEQFSGFTYYPDTLSFSTYTLLGSPAMYGGYEYSIPEINARDGELLRDKHTEALLVMPVLFKNAGFDTYMFDPPNTNYFPKNDLSVYTERGIHAQNIYGTYTKNYLKALDLPLDTENDSYTRKGIRYFSIMQMLWHPLRWTFYVITLNDGMDYTFENSYSSLFFMNELTDFSDKNGSFIFIDNETNHEYRFLNAPEFDRKSAKRDNSTGSYKYHDDQDMMAYHMLAASMKSLGKWMDFLKVNGCYDNTRIIIVSDHGWHLHSEQVFGSFPDPVVPAEFNPLLMFKDFNAEGAMKTDMEFMTNADTLFLAGKNLDASLTDLNPFTGKKLVQDKAGGVTVVPGVNLEWLSSKMYEEKTFSVDKENSYVVHDDLFKPENWIPLAGK